MKVINLKDGSLAFGTECGHFVPSKKGVCRNWVGRPPTPGEEEKARKIFFMIKTP